MAKLLLILIPFLLLAANFKLYLKDGGYHIVSEYKVEGDRIRFHAVERGEWEEMPIELVDLAKTRQVIKDREDSDREQAKLIDEEEKAERAERREIARVPEDPGVYYVDGAELKPLKTAETKFTTNKRRSILQVITPIPIVTGKATLDIDNESSTFVVNNSQPEFYFRLTAPERFGILKLTPGKAVRIVEKVTIVPVSKEMVEERIDVEIFRRQAGDLLYKIWPMEPLEPGEYAVVQFTEGKINMQLWDFSYKKK
jgi:hypothetical protein